MYTMCRFERKRHFPVLERFFRGHTGPSFVGNLAGMALSPGRKMDEMTSPVSLL